MELDYETLVERYTTNLQDTLRNFSPGPEFLDTWVHEEDHNKSIFGIFDAAEVAQLKEPLSVKVGAKVAGSLDVTTLKDLLEQIGEVSIQEKGNEGLTIQLDFNQPAKKKVVQATGQASKSQTRVSSRDEGKGEWSFDNKTFDTALGQVSMNPIYEQAVVKSAENIVFEGKLAGDGRDPVWEVTEEGITLRCLINQRSQVTAAKHQGASELNKILMDQFCRIIQNLSLQEASEHGVIRLEYELRDKAVQRSVQGIMTPENGDPAFSIPTKLIRKLYRNFLSETSSETKRNFWTDSPRQQWLTLSHEDRLKRASEALLEAKKQVGIETMPMEIVDIKAETRLVFAVEPKESLAFGPYMIKVERILKSKLDPQVEILLESKSDKNKRHASRSEEATATSYGTQPS